MALSSRRYPTVFSLQLTWLHYRALTRVDSTEVRYFHERMLKSERPEKMLAMEEQIRLEIENGLGLIESNLKEQANG